MNSKSGHFNEQRDKIENYLKGQLTDEQQREFEKQLETDPELKTNTRFLKNLGVVVNDPRRVEAAGILMDLRTKRLGVNKKSKIREHWDRLNYWAKASIVIIAVAGILALLIISNVFIKADCDKLFEKNLKPYPSVFPSASTNSQDLDAAIANYQSRNWAEAREGFEPFKEKDDILYFYYAVSYLHDRDEEISQNKLLFNSLEEAFEQEESYALLSTWVRYYIALIDLKNEEFNKAKESINELKKDPFLDRELRQIVEQFSDDLWWYLF